MYIMLYKPENMSVSMFCAVYVLCNILCIQYDAKCAKCGDVK